MKEYYFYLDSTPTHSYMKYLYKYPQAPYPYDNIVRTNKQLGFHALEYELIDTGVFEGDRYFDVFVEYAKASPDDLLVEITVCNRGPEAGHPARAADGLVPEHVVVGRKRAPSPMQQAPAPLRGTIAISHPELGSRFLSCDGGPDLLFTENETNTERLFGVPNPSPYVKDGDQQLPRAR